MHAGFLDVLHDACDQNVAVLVGKRIHVNLGGVFQKTIDQHWPRLRKNHRFAHVAANHFLVVRNHHGASA